MSDTVPGIVAPTDHPRIVIYARDDASLVAHVHRGERLRTVFAATLAQLKRRLVSVLVSEFRYSQPAAMAVANDSGLRPGPTVDDLAAETYRADVAEKALNEVQEKLSEAESEIKKLRELVEKLGGKLDVSAEPTPDALPAAKV